MHAIGASDLTAYAVQIVLFAIVAIIIWRVVASELDDRAIAATAVATIIATPFAFIYDLPMIAAALVIEERRRRCLGVPVNIWEIAVVSLMFTVVLGMTVWTMPFAALAVLTAIFWLIVYRSGADKVTA
jgi:hypothetical protein